MQLYASFIQYERIRTILNGNWFKKKVAGFCCYVTHQNFLIDIVRSITNRIGWVFLRREKASVVTGFNYEIRKL